MHASMVHKALATLRLSCYYTQLNEELLQWRTQHRGEADPLTQIPDQLVDDLVRGRYVGQPLWYGRLLSNPSSGLNIQKFWYGLLEEILGMDYSTCRNGYEFATVSHLTAGYGAGYYSFAKDPWNKQTWNEYRQIILEPGSSKKNLLRLLENSLGRASNPDALVQGWL
ncbi:hypothetical protein AnigIFM59636_002025 [Aspergillus niger]|nr:hypothetical protein AnigIFM59636_002025 [Aspergillus niger]